MCYGPLETCSVQCSVTEILRHDNTQYVDYLAIFDWESDFDPVSVFMSFVEYCFFSVSLKIGLFLIPLSIFENRPVFQTTAELGCANIHFDISDL